MTANIKRRLEQGIFVGVLLIVALVAQKHALTANDEPQQKPQALECVEIQALHHPDQDYY